MRRDTFCLILTTLFLLLGKSSAKEKNGNGRIIGGHPAYDDQYPFAAAIQVQTDTSRYFCGGTLYLRQWILTAGQCVNRGVLFTITLGSSNLDNPDPSSITLATSEYFLHPDFDPLTLDNDIGLIELRMQITLTNFIQPVTALAFSALADQSYLRAIGWGQTTDDSSSLSSQLQYVYVTSLSNAECRMVYGSAITDNMVCIEGNYNEGSCHGDTGSPLLETYGRYEFLHVGVSSFISGNGCESMDPSGYTRTYPYISWIRNITGV